MKDILLKAVTRGVSSRDILSSKLELHLTSFITGSSHIQMEESNQKYPVNLTLGERWIVYKAVHCESISPSISFLSDYSLSTVHNDSFHSRSAVVGCQTCAFKRGTVDHIDHIDAGLNPSISIGF